MQQINAVLTMSQSKGTNSLRAVICHEVPVTHAHIVASTTTMSATCIWTFWSNIPKSIEENPGNRHWYPTLETTGHLKETKRFETCTLCTIPHRFVMDIELTIYTGTNRCQFWIDGAYSWSRFFILYLVKGSVQGFPSGFNPLLLEWWEVKKFNDSRK